MFTNCLQDAKDYIHRLNQGQIKSICLFFDYLVERIVRSFSADEYFSILKLYTIPRKKRSEYISNRKFSDFIKKKNGGRIAYFDDKRLFLECNKELVHRDWILLNNKNLDRYLYFIEKHHSFIIKPNIGSFGQGISIKDIGDYDLSGKIALFHDLEGRLLEEIVYGCNELQSFHPKSLNTIRIITCFHKKQRAKVLYAFIKFGRGNSVVDNGHLGGLWIMIDISDGRVIGNARSADGKEYIYHPDTKQKITGLVIPCWETIVEFSLKCAEMNPKAIIAGWDIALTNAYTPLLIEGNCTPNVDLIQASLGHGIKNEIIGIINDDVKELEG